MPTHIQPLIVETYNESTVNDRKAILATVGVSADDQAIYGERDFFNLPESIQWALAPELAPPTEQPAEGGG